MNYLLLLVIVLLVFYWHEWLFLPAYKTHAPPGSILITGASRGLGKAASLHLAGMGYKVYAGVRKEADGERLKEAASDTATRMLLEPVILDVTKPEQVIAAEAHIRSQNDRYPLFGVVNNAGISARYPFEFADEADWRQMIDINLVGALDVAQKFLPLLRESQGRLVNIGSLAGETGIPFAQTYSAVKAAIRAFSDSMRRELKMQGVFVGTVEPGYVLTDITASSVNKGRQAWERIPEALRKYFPYLHPDSLDAVREIEQKANATPVPWTSECIAHAMLDAHPRPRYLNANWSSRTKISFGWYAPDWLVDLIHGFRMSRAYAYIGRKDEL